MRRIAYLIFISFLFLTVKGQAQDSLLNTSKLPRHFILQEDFSKASSRWNNFEHANAKAERKAGKYYFENKLPDSDWRMWNSYNIDPTRNYYIELIFSKEKGPDNYGSGIIFNQSDTKKDNSFNFTIAPNQYFTLYHYENDKNITDQEWTPCSFVHTTGNNKIAIWAKGSTMNFYVNDHLVHSMPRPVYKGTQIGFTLARSTTIAIDQFNIRYNPLPFDEVENAKQGYQKVSVGGGVNSEGDDNFPTVSADGLLMFFDRSQDMGVKGQDQRTVMYSEYDTTSKQWSTAKALPASINKRGRPQVIYVSPDKNTLILSGVYKDGEFNDGNGMSISHKTSDGWSTPTEMPIQDYDNLSYYGGYTFSSNTKVMIVSYQTEHGYGERDLCVSFREGDHWTKPKNMGAIVNSFGTESHPCLAPDNVTLYYSSGGKPGYGQLDIFVTRRLDDSWLNWSPPLNLGPDFNTPKNDSGLEVDAYGEYAFIDDDVVGKKSEIFRIKIPESARPQPVVIVKGKVYDKLSGKPFSAQIIYEDLERNREEGQAVSHPNDGSFVLILPYGVNYSLVGKAKGYMAESKNINIKDSIQKGFVEMHVDLYLTPIQAGSSLTLNSIFFDPDEYALLETSRAELDRLYHLMIDNPQLTIEIEGHTDRGGEHATDESLNTLSLNRALAVRTYLINKNIAAERMTPVGYGRSRPVSQNNNSLNRRVEIKVIKN